LVLLKLKNVSFVQDIDGARVKFVVKFSNERYGQDDETIDLLKQVVDYNDLIVSMMREMLVDCNKNGEHFPAILVVRDQVGQVKVMVSTSGHQRVRFFV